MNEKEKREKKNLPEPRILPPAEFAALLRTAPPQLLPAIVLSGFCGLRTGELLRIEWSSIDLKEKTVLIEGTTKAPRRHLVPLPDAAVAWLKLLARSSGQVISHKSYNELFLDLRQAWKAAGISQPCKPLRSSALPYIFAMGTDEEQTASQVGISASRPVEQHTPPARKDAEEWFAIFPCSLQSE